MNKQALFGWPKKVPKVPPVPASAEQQIADILKKLQDLQLGGHGDKVDRMLELITKGVKDKADVPVGLLLGAAGAAGLGGFALSKYRKAGSGPSGAEKRRRNIELYQTLESPYADEDSAIDEALLAKESAISGGDVLLGAGAAAIPAYVIYDAIRNRKEQQKLQQDKADVQTLRDMVDASYKKDMLDTYGVTEDDLQEALKQMKAEAGLDKESAAVEGYGRAATTAAAGALGLASFLGATETIKKLHPHYRQRDAYLKAVDKLHRSRTESPTIGRLPLSDEELLALEYIKRRGLHNIKKDPEELARAETELALPEGSEPLAPERERPEVLELAPPEPGKDSVELNSEDMSDILQSL